MKVLLLTLFVAAASAVPLPSERLANDAVELIVNGVPEGQALDIENVVDINLKERVAGQVVAATDLLYPMTAAGLAEAAAAEAEIADAPLPVILPTPVAPEVVPAPVVMPSPAQPEVIVVDPIVMPSPAEPEVVLPEPIVLPQPAIPDVVPQPIVLPSPAVPEIVPVPIVIPAPAVPEVVEILPVPAPQLPTGEIYNDGVVEVHVNAPEESGILSTLQSWLSLALNYISNGAQTTQQIV